MFESKLLICHRGDRTYKENSREAVVSAFKKGATHVEIDVRSRGDTLFLSHPPILTQNKLTQLEDVLSAIQDLPEAKLILHPKETAIVDRMLKLVEKYGFSNRIIIWSFNHKLIKKINSSYGDKFCKATILTLRPFSNQEILARAKDCGANYVYSMIRNIDAKYFNSNGIGIIRLTSNEESAMKYLDSGVAGILTDSIDLIQILKRKVNNSAGNPKPEGGA